LVLYEDYEKAVFYVANRKKIKVLRYRLFYIRLAVYSFLLPPLGYTGKLFISPIAATVFYGCLMLFYAVKLYIKKCKSSKTLMLVSVRIYQLLQLVYIIDKF
jgi:protoheme IX farnesyltransferase